MSISKLGTSPYRGTRDFLPVEMSIRTQIFEKLFRTVELFGFRRYDGPILEPAIMYEVKSGEEISKEQMYRLTDKGGRELALRPEMTPSIARIIAGNQDKITFPSRWYSHVNCHRYERPQRGRLREHWQLNVDLFGSTELDAEVEIFDLIEALMSSLGATNTMYTLRVNDRQLVEAALKNHVGVPVHLLNPVGTVMDKWNKISEQTRLTVLQDLGLSVAQIGSLNALVEFGLDDFCEAAGDDSAKESRIAQIIRGDMTKAPVVFDPHIMRAFDYYTSTVFEVFDTSPENNRSLFGGGRYDDLAKMFIKKQIPGIGFGMGDVTTWNFLESRCLLPKPDITPDIYAFATDEEYRPEILGLVRQMRNSGTRVVSALSRMSMKSGLREANRTGCKICLIIGEKEAVADCVMVKNMVTSEQVIVNVAVALKTISEVLMQSA